jgi:hypothetical protein
MYYLEEPSFLFTQYREKVSKAVVTEEQETRLSEAFDYVNELYKKLSSENKPLFVKLKRKTHLISLAYMALLAHDRKINIETYIAKATKFFNTPNKNASISSSYNDACSKSSSKAEAVAIRKREMDKALGTKSTVKSEGLFSV